MGHGTIILVTTPTLFWQKTWIFLPLLGPIICWRHSFASWISSIHSGNLSEDHNAWLLPAFHTELLPFPALPLVPFCKRPIRCWYRYIYFSLLPSIKALPFTNIYKIQEHMQPRRFRGKSHGTHHDELDKRPEYRNHVQTLGLRFWSLQTFPSSPLHESSSISFACFFFKEYIQLPAHTFIIIPRFSPCLKILTWYWMLGTVPLKTNYQFQPLSWQYWRQPITAGLNIESVTSQAFRALRNSMSRKRYHYDNNSMWSWGK